MTKHILATLGLTAALIAPTAYAQDAAPFTGPYIGLEGSYTKDKFKQLDDIDGVTDITKLSDKDYGYGGFAGYRFQMDNGLVVGLEGRYSQPNTSVSLADGYTLNAGREYGADLHVGMAMDQSLVYGILGYGKGRASLYDAADALEDRNSRNAYRYGVGYEQNMSENMFVRGSAVYTDYRNSDLGPNRSSSTSMNVGVGFRF